LIRRVRTGDKHVQNKLAEHASRLEVKLNQANQMLENLRGDDSRDETSGTESTAGKRAALQQFSQPVATAERRAAVGGGVGREAKPAGRSSTGGGAIASTSGAGGGDDACDDGGGEGAQSERQSDEQGSGSEGRRSKSDGSDGEGVGNSDDD
jgi:hypothetical protein